MDIKSVVIVCVKIYKSVEQYTSKLIRETNRFTAITPSRYFELLDIFVERFGEHVEQTNTDVKKYVGGVEKITTMRAQITALSIQLDNDIPVLKKKKEVEEMMKDLQVKQNEVQGTRGNVQKRSKSASFEEHDLHWPVDNLKISRR